MLHLITNQEILLFAFCSIYVLITKEISIFFVTFEIQSFFVIELIVQLSLIVRFFVWL